MADVSLNFVHSSLPIVAMTPPPLAPSIANSATAQNAKLHKVGKGAALTSAAATAAAVPGSTSQQQQQQQQQNKDAKAAVEEVLEYFNPRESAMAEQTLDKYFQRVAQKFMSESKVSNCAPNEKALKEHFSNASVPQDPANLSNYFLKLVENVVVQTTHCHSPLMIGHMTSALPYFHRPLSQLVTALNQNTVKVETSSMVTFLEHEAIGKLHKTFYGNKTTRDEAFYQANIHNPESCMGCITSGGTLANLTALWVARNTALGPQGDFGGVEKEGLFRALKYYGYEDAVILGSDLMHYSMKKATDTLGLGTSGLVTIPYNDEYRVKIDLLEEKILECQRKKILVLAIVGVAGATEAGTIDDLQAIGTLARRHRIHFHVDAAWGGPLIFSKTHRGKLAGLELSDSVTIDGHKQLYTPMGCGVVLFSNPTAARSIRKTANYIIRTDSHDAGKFSPEGSRPASAIYLHACLTLLGVSGYEALIDRSCAHVRYLASKVKASDDFEVIVEPVSNIMLYRWIPAQFREKRAAGKLTKEDNEVINQKNVELQTLVCKEAESFVSRTTVFVPRYNTRIVGLRVVIANPNTHRDHIDRALREQRDLIKKHNM